MGIGPYGAIVPSRYDSCLDHPCAMTSQGTERAVTVDEHLYLRIGSTGDYRFDE